MKRQNLLLVLALFLVLGQWSSFEHAFHKHEANEVCDFCLSKSPLEQLATNSIQLFNPVSFSQPQDKLVFQLAVSNKTSYFAARAPPRFF